MAQTRSGPWRSLRQRTVTNSLHLYSTRCQSVISFLILFSFSIFKIHFFPRCLYHGWGGFQANLDKAAEAFKAGAEEGFLSICTLFFFNGEEGDIDSHRLYGFCLERGFGGNCNLKEAFANYLAAAEQADAISSQIAARFLMQGKGCERNLTKAWYCYRRADDQHYRRASHMLNDVAFKNFFMHERCRERVIWLLTLKKVHKNDCGMFSILMPDLVKIIAQKLWETRNDDEWKTNEELLEMDKKK